MSLHPSAAAYRRYRPRMRSIPLVFSLGLILTSCGQASVPDESRPAPFADLDDPVVAAALGSPEFDDVAWERRAGRWTIVGDGPLPQPTDVEIIQAASSDIPAAITAEPRQLIRTSSAGAPADHPASAAVAVAKGPDVYLLDAAFAGSRAATRWSVGRVLVHELVHVAQWYELSDAYVAAARAGDIESLALDDGSKLVGDWADATGWTDTKADSLQSTWSLTGTAPNAYAQTSPAEDMAESVSLAAAGLGDWLDAERATWVESWAGVSLETLAIGKPWAPFGAVEVAAEAPLYDETAALAAAPPGSTHADPLYFELPSDSPPIGEIAAVLTSRLNGRDIPGELRLDGQQYNGTFVRSDGSVFWVELIEGRDLGADGPLLIYVWLW